MDELRFRRVCWLACAVLLVASRGEADVLRFDAAGDPFDRSAAFRLDLDLPVLSRDALVLGAGYAQRSFWTLDNDGGNDRVETDFAPGVFLRLRRGAWRIESAYVHQSNGRLDAASRSWNRAVGRVRRDFGTATFELALWAAFRVEDTNPDLRRTIGDGEVVWATDPERHWSGEVRLGFTFDPLDGSPITSAAARTTTALPTGLFPGAGVRGLLEIFWGRGESLARNEEIARALRIGLSLRR